LAEGGVALGLGAAEDDADEAGEVDLAFLVVELEAQLVAGDAEGDTAHGDDGVVLDDEGGVLGAGGEGDRPGLLHLVGSALPDFAEGFDGDVEAVALGERGGDAERFFGPVEDRGGDLVVAGEDDAIAGGGGGGLGGGEGWCRAGR
jgi:hypothetical protein